MLPSLNEMLLSLQVIEALAHAGLESSNLIVGIDFTKSNEWTGARSYNRRSLHYIGSGLNPYEQAIFIIGKTLAAFDEDNLIPFYGFGDASTHDQDVLSFYPDDRFCNGFEEVLSQYREIVPHLRLAGPTSFGPIIEMAMTIVEKSGGQYHVLLIIADGQVTGSVDTEHGQLSPQEKKTVEAIVTASGRKGNVLERVPLPSPVYSALSFSSSKSSCSSNFQQKSAPYHGHSSPVSTAPPASSSTFDNQVLGPIQKYKIPSAVVHNGVVNVMSDDVIKLEGGRGENVVRMRSLWTRSAEHKGLEDSSVASSSRLGMKLQGCILFKQLQSVGQSIRSSRKATQRINFRSNMSGVIKVVSELRRTPFCLMFEAIIINKPDFNEYKKCDDLVVKILRMFNLRDDAFYVGDCLVKVSKADIKLVFGLQCGV
ncbi:hypothetical protein ACSBR2_031106 [Camellia fascicularis]